MNKLLTPKQRRVNAAAFSSNSTLSVEAFQENQLTRNTIVLLYSIMTLYGASSLRYAIEYGY